MKITALNGVLALLVAVVFSSCAIQAGRDDLKIDKVVKKLDKVEQYTEYKSLADQFSRLREKNPDNWLTSYYHAFCLLQYALRTPQIEEVDQYCDRALESLDAIDPGQANTAEVLCLRAMEQSVRIRVDVMLRGLEYSMNSETFLEKALQLDPDNPRAFLLRGQNTFNRPEMFGGGKNAAKPFFEKSVAYFQQEKKNLPEPSWGQQSAVSMLSACN
jgi:tetratricopeptide (TPR) repeat protein